MSFSDDYASPPQPFSGDETGDIFQEQQQDLIWDSPTTTERVVDTQSGFVVVLRRVDSRLALSVKRRLGTPPVSSILLTPDESLKLARILAGPQLTERTPVTGTISPDVDDWLNKFSKSEGFHDAVSEYVHEDDDGATSGGVNFASSPYPHRGQTYQEEELSPAGAYAEAMARRQARQGRKKPSLVSHQTLMTLASGALAVALAASAIAILFSSYKPKTTTPVVAAVKDPLDPESVDKFARRYVGNMLDFNPATYRGSQVQAMAVMGPAAMEKYWNETNFPLPKAKLSSLPQGQTVLITRLTQERVDDKTKTVDIYAELVGPDSKISSPLHLRLNLVKDVDDQLRVLEQTDLSNGPS